MSFCDTLLYIEKLEVCEASWSSNDAVEEKPGFSSSWSWRESFWLKSRQQKKKNVFSNYLCSEIQSKQRIILIKENPLKINQLMGAKAPVIESSFKY